jgi:predicted  nucleic acid-binding Zn-ribbon protein
MNSLEDFKDQTLQRITRVEEKTSSNENRISAVESKTEDIPELKTLMKLTIETNKEQSQTLLKINENLTGLNGEMKNLGGRVKTLEDSQNGNKIDIVSLVKQVIWVGVPALLVWWFTK